MEAAGTDGDVEGRPRYVALMSGGIDSPVAAHLMLARGAQLVLVHFDNRPYTDDAEVDKAHRLVARLRELHGEVPAYMVPHGETAQRAFERDAMRRLGCVLCKRMMLRVASAIAHREGAQGLVTGESLGQVASQTLANIRAESAALGGLPAVRPLIGLDKLDIIRVAKDIGTYDLSTGPGAGCKLVPDGPSVSARLAEVEAEEAHVDIDALVEAALQGARPM